MPPQLTYPGVYVEEIPSGVRTITGVATSITAFVGRTRRGPVAAPFTIYSYADFERNFGGLWLDSPLGYAVRDFYLNGGAQAIIVRLYRAPDGGGVAKLTVGDVTLVAASPGAWGGGLRASIDVTDVPADQPDAFNLTVTDTSPGGRSERFVAVSLKSDSTRRLDHVLERSSESRALGRRRRPRPGERARRRRGRGLGRRGRGRRRRQGSRRQAEGGQGGEAGARPGAGGAGRGRSHSAPGAQGRGRRRGDGVDERGQGGDRRADRTRRRQGRRDREGHGHGGRRRRGARRDRVHRHSGSRRPRPRRPLQPAVHPAPRARQGHRTRPRRHRRRVLRAAAGDAPGGSAVGLAVDERGGRRLRGRARRDRDPEPQRGDLLPPSVGGRSGARRPSPGVRALRSRRRRLRPHRLRARHLEGAGRPRREPPRRCAT